MLMKKTSVLSAAFACLLAISLTVSATNARQAEQEANDILDATGVKGGFIVHIGCGERQRCTQTKATPYTAWTKMRATSSRPARIFVRLIFTARYLSTK